MKQNITPIIMAGGSGTRLWPLSRVQYPKQFLKLGLSEYSLLQNTVLRLGNLDNCNSPIIVCNEEHRFLVAEQLREINIGATIILEPIAKNTAPAITLAALHLSKQEKNSAMLVLAADHVILNQEAFEDGLKNAIDGINQNKLVTFGIVPTHPETGYGYIEAAKDNNTSPYKAIKQFVEKPNKQAAENYLKSGDFLWNSGMFMLSCRQYLEELQQYAPDIFEICQMSMNNTTLDLDFIRIDENAFSQCRSESIDYAIMEKTKNAVVVPLDAGWSDVGSWSSLWDIGQKDSNNNVALGDVILNQSHDNYCYSDSRLVTLLGVENLVVIETKDAVLVANKDRTQDIKSIVEELRQKGRCEHNFHREVYRPWGKYDSIDHAERYQVKRITVNPGQKLSAQMHHHRSEHWIVVKGTAKIHKGKESFLLTENQSIYIPLGEVHALENPGKLPLELIEVQSGSYLGEDDIVRFSDIYGRV